MKMPARSRNGKTPVRDAFGCDQGIREGMDKFGFSFDQYDFQTIVMIQMYANRGYDGREILMLEFSETFREQSRVVIINERHCSKNLCFGCGCFLCDKLIPDQVPKCLGAVCVTALRDQIVELL
jgi:hypothetical protein